MARYKVRVVSGPDLQHAELLLWARTTSVKSSYSLKSAFVHLVKPGPLEFKELSVIIEADDAGAAESHVRDWIGDRYQLEAMDLSGSTA